MADIKKRLSTNVKGPFFVDSTCINCDACRQLAPASFVEQGEYSTVFAQPATGREILEAYRALLACPVGSIGVISIDKPRRQEAMESFPLQIEGSVFYNGFNSEKSFGASSYLIQHPEGNWLIDSPRYVKRLVEAFEQMGGVRYIFLSHEDDVADAWRYARHFGATRIIHRADVAAEPDAEWVIEGEGIVEVAPKFLIIPSPGHTPGSMVLLHDNRYLFSGDHLFWDRDTETLRLPSVYLWSEAAILRSAERLLEFSFEWILPGHGDRARCQKSAMHEALQSLLTTRRQMSRMS